MPDQACFMAAYGPLSSVDVMMAPAFMSSSEKWVILIENTLPYYHQQMGQFIWVYMSWHQAHRLMCQGDLPDIKETCLT